jgi:putative flippase GtrA
MDSQSAHRSVADSVASPRHVAGDRAASHGWSSRGSLGWHVGSFALIGVASTVAYAVLYTAFRSVLPATDANALALLISAIGNTAANRRLTFGVRGRQSVIRDHGAGLAAFAIALGLTSGSISLLHALAPGAGRPVELVVLTLANVLATVVRFALLRAWIARPRPALSSPSRA